MGNYKRKVTYFYQYHNGNVGATAGFLKMEIRGDNVKITINIQESSGIDRENPVLYFYHETGEKLSAVKICEVKRQGGVLTMQTKTPWREVFDTGRDLYTFDGVLVLYSEKDYYLGDFDDRDRSSYDLALEKINKTKTSNLPDINTVNEIKENTEDVGAKDVEAGDIDKDDTNITTGDNASGNIDIEREYNEGKTNEQTEENPFDQMLREYPKLPMYNAEELFDCVRINPRDIGRLDIGNWKLGSNSFLTHGYYTYQYLMLGKMLFGDGRKHAVLGVPGVYTNREKYIAGMFGFDQFIPVKKTGLKTGQFGYWIVELCQER